MLSATNPRCRPTYQVPEHRSKPTFYRSPNLPYINTKPTIYLAQYCRYMAPHPPKRPLKGSRPVTEVPKWTPSKSGKQSSALALCRLNKGSHLAGRRGGLRAHREDLCPSGHVFAESSYIYVYACVCIYIYTHAYIYIY